MQDIFSYSLNDFLLFSSDTYIALATDFVSHYIYLLIIPLLAGLLLAALYNGGQQLKRHLFFVMLITVMLPIGMFYLSHYSQIQPFFLWFLGATGIQMLLTLFIAFRFMKVKGMALFTIKDLLPEPRAFHLILLSILLLQAALVSKHWQTSWEMVLFVPATYWWTMTMLFLFSSANIRIWLLPIPLIMAIVEIVTLSLLNIPFVWLYLALPVIVFVAARVKSPKRL
ncbi:MAG: hypothetical protein ACFHVJ_17870 [Aestuariibacter sp.]